MSFPKMSPATAPFAIGVACALAILGLPALERSVSAEEPSGLIAESSQSGSIVTLPDPTSITLVATRPGLPEPQKIGLVVRRPDLPDPVRMTLVANRPDLPDPSRITLVARRSSIPDPLGITLAVNRPDLPEPIELTLIARRGGLPDPIGMTLVARRPEIPEPLELRLVATRPRLPDPFRLTLGVGRPDDALVAVPKVIGLGLLEARDAVADAKLKPEPAVGDAADERDKEPGRVYAAEPGEGKKIAAGSPVTLTAYGPRPKKPVPSLAGLSLASAKALLQETKFTAGEPALGEAAPDGGEPGMVSGSIPPAGTLAEIFSVVQPVLYGPRRQEPVAEEPALRPIPSLVGLTVKAAEARLRAHGFVAGPAASGEPAPAQEEPGRVYASVPRAGVLAREKTVVLPLVYGERPQDRTDGPADDQAAETDTEPDREDEPDIVATGPTDDRPEEAACIPRDQVKRVCYSRDGRDSLCRANNCSIPARTKRVCRSGDGRHKMCQRNGCNPLFTNPNGSTFRVPCKWVDEVVQVAVPCYWKDEIPEGRRVCDEDETTGRADVGPETGRPPRPDPEPDSPRVSGWAGRWTLRAQMKPPHSGRLRAVVQITDEADGTYLTGITHGRKEGHIKLKVDAQTIRFKSPLPNGSVLHWTLTRQGDTCSGNLTARGRTGTTRWLVSGKRS